MNSSDLITGMYEYGRNKALELRENASGMTDTEVIDQESFIPEWRAGIQVLNALVRRSVLNQVYRVLQAHDSSGNQGWTPETQPALFSVCHTKDPVKAKPWAAPAGTSGMYELGDCYKDASGIIWRQIYDGDNVYDAATLPERWEQI